MNIWSIEFGNSAASLGEIFATPDDRSVLSATRRVVNSLNHGGRLQLAMWWRANAPSVRGHVLDHALDAAKAAAVGECVRQFSTVRFARPTRSSRVRAAIVFQPRHQTEAIHHGAQQMN
jgi:hypothetical protein